MNQKYKFVIKIWSIALILGASTTFAEKIIQNTELVLSFRLAGSVFFFALYLHVCKVVKKIDEDIKQSNGFKQNIFDPNILKITLKLCIFGWTMFAILDYFNLNLINWIIVFMLGVLIIPFSLGLIPLTLKDNAWRNKK